MFSLVITLVAIALVALLALAAIFYGGSAFFDKSAQAEAARAVQEGQQILSAMELYRTDQGAWPSMAQLLGGKKAGIDYLKAVPNGEWAIVTGFPTAYRLQATTEGVCRAVNRMTRGDNGILNKLSTQYSTQCYQNASGAFTVVVTKGGNEESLLAVPSVGVDEVTLRAAPVSEPGDPLWALPPVEGGTGAGQPSAPKGPLPSLGLTSESLDAYMALSGSTATGFTASADLTTLYDGAASTPFAQSLGGLQLYTFRLTNTGSAPVSLGFPSKGSVFNIGSSSGVYAAPNMTPDELSTLASPLSSAYGHELCGSTLAAGASCTMLVAWSFDAEGGCVNASGGVFTANGNSIPVTTAGTPDCASVPVKAPPVLALNGVTSTKLLTLDTMYQAGLPADVTVIDAATEQTFDITVQNDSGYDYSNLQSLALMWEASEAFRSFQPDYSAFPNNCLNIKGGGLASGTSCTLRVALSFNPAGGTFAGAVYLWPQENLGGSRPVSALYISGNVKAAAQANLSLSSSSVAFGDTDYQSPSVRSLSVSNTGTASATFTVQKTPQLTTLSGSCFAAGTPVVLPAGTSCTVTLTYSPSLLSGYSGSAQYTDELVLSTSVSAQSSLLLPVSANLTGGFCAGTDPAPCSGGGTSGTPRFSLYSGDLLYGTLDTSSYLAEYQRTRYLYFTNTGTVTASVQPQLPAAFAVVGSSCDSLPAQASCYMAVRLQAAAPDSGSGQWTLANATLDEGAQSYQYVLSTGQPAQPAPVASVGTPTLSEPVLTYLMDESRTLTITVPNTGNVALHFDGSLGTENSVIDYPRQMLVPLFAVTANTCTTVQPGEQCTISLKTQRIWSQPGGYYEYERTLWLPFTSDNANAGNTTLVVPTKAVVLGGVTIGGRLVVGSGSGLMTRNWYQANSACTGTQLSSLFGTSFQLPSRTEAAAFRTAANVDSATLEKFSMVMGFASVTPDTWQSWSRDYYGFIDGMFGPQEYAYAINGSTYQTYSAYAAPLCFGPAP